MATESVFYFYVAVLSVHLWSDFVGEAVSELN